MLAYLGPAYVTGTVNAQDFFSPKPRDMTLSIQGLLSGYFLFYRPAIGLVVASIAASIGILVFFIVGILLKKGRARSPLFLTIVGLAGALVSSPAGLAFLRVGETLFAYTWLMTIGGFMAAAMVFARFADPSETPNDTSLPQSDSGADAAPDWAIAAARRIAEKD